jgi:8-oxo-dGTP pyrophosphatase MutT (NUDIX family)
MMQRRSGNPRLAFEDGVRPLAACALKVSSRDWPFAKVNAAAIDGNWTQARQSNPNYFNGIIHLIEDVRIGGDSLECSLVRTDFKSYLFWRALGFPEAGVLDGFGSALIRSSDGCIMLGRQRQGNVNGGLVYLPAGFIDERDVDANGSIDIAASVAREVAEETGIDHSAIVREAGYYLTRSGAQLSIAIPFRAAMTAAEFVDRAGRHIALSKEPELEAVIPVAALGDIADLQVTPYARLLLETLLAAEV